MDQNSLKVVQINLYLSKEAFYKKKFDPKLNKLIVTKKKLLDEFQLSKDIYFITVAGIQNIEDL